MDNFWNEFPYTDYQKINLDYMLEKFPEFEQRIKALEESENHESVSGIYFVTYGVTSFSDISSAIADRKFPVLKDGNNYGMLNAVFPVNISFFRMSGGIVYNYIINDITGWATYTAEYVTTQSPHFTGIPTAPTAPSGTNSAQIATTAFVKKSLDDLPSISETQIQDAVDDWLEENITQETGYVLDESLTLSTAASPASKVGELKHELAYSTDIYISTVETLGYIGVNGSVNSPVNANREVYTDYIPVDINTELNFYMYSTANAYPMWSKLALYDANRNFIRRIDLYYRSGTTVKSNNTVWKNTDSNIAYVRYTYRTGTMAGGQWIFTTITHRRIAELANQVAKNYTYVMQNRFIQTAVSDGDIVDLTPLAYSRLACAVIDCSKDDVFTITGLGSSNGLLWAFLDSTNHLLTHAVRNEYAVTKKIVAPVNAAKLVVNFQMLSDYAIYKGFNVSTTNEERCAVVQDAVIHELPKNFVAMPTVDFESYVQQTQNVAGAKPAIYKNGDWFVITYGENLDGNGTDIPKVTDSGVLAMKFKKFKLVNGEESNVSYGTIAQKGTTYKDYNGNTATSVGGWGLPSGVDNMQYFTTVYTGSYTYNGEANYGMTPCCCSVSLSADGTLSFGEIKELTLEINGVVGKFDVTRLSIENSSYALYLTTAAPYHSSAGYKWMIPIIGGFIYLTSDNGINWVYNWTHETPFQPECEMSCVLMGTGNLLYAARTQTRNSISGDTLYVGSISQTGNPNGIYKIPFSASRAFLIRSGSDVLLFCTLGTKDACCVIRVIIENTFNHYFWKWFTIWHNCTWYTTCYNSVFPNNFTKMYLCGGNGAIGSLGGMTFLELTFDASKARTPTDVPFVIE